VIKLSIVLKNQPLLCHNSELLDMSLISQAAHTLLETLVRQEVSVLLDPSSRNLVHQENITAKRDSIFQLLVWVVQLVAIALVHHFLPEQM
jgi:hypothetical protein